MPLPKLLSNQALGGLRVKDGDLNYESHRQLTDYVNQVVTAIGPGTLITPASFSMMGMGVNPTITGTSGTYTRGRFTLTIGATPASNGTVTLTFPRGTFNETPFATVVRNGGTGTIGFTYSESTAALVITLSGLPVVTQTFVFQFAVRS